MTRLIIIADDLTGAGDAAAHLAQVSRVHLVLSTTALWSDADVITVDTDSRSMNSAEAAQRVGEAVARAAATGATVFKKIDSLLRGNVAVEVDAALTAMTRADEKPLAVVAPAFPGVGRTTVGGVVNVDGVSQGESGDIAAVLATAGLSAVHADARSGADALADAFARAHVEGRSAVVVDATTDEDLAEIVTACDRVSFPILPVGSGGLARPYDGLFDTTAPAEDTLSIASPVLYVVGSHTVNARQQLGELGRADVPIVSISDGCPDRRDDVRQGLASGVVAVCPDQTSPVDITRSDFIATRLADNVMECLPDVGTVVACGGQTARAILERAGVTELVILGEREPGVVVGRPLGVGWRLVTKSGSFGDVGVLLRCLSAQNL